MASEKNIELLNSLALRVKSLREKKDVSQNDAFNDTGIHFGRIEQGKRDASISTLKKISTYFEIELEELVKGL